MSSESTVRIVRINDLSSIANADALQLTHVHGGYPCLVRTGQFQLGQLAAYVPIDMIVPTDRSAFAFLDGKAKNGRYRVRALRLRGTFSMGLLVPVPDGLTVVEGDDLTTYFGAEKYEPPVDLTTGGENEHDPGIMPVYTDIEAR